MPYSAPTETDAPETPVPANKIIKHPSDFVSAQEFLTHVRKLFRDDLDFDRLNREASVEDAKFMVGDQWDDRVRARRNRAKKPILTINRLPAFVAQIVGNRRVNETSIVVKPTSDGKKKVAETRQGLIRSIEQLSKADRAYDLALQNCVIGGIGGFGIKLAYASDDVFDQNIVFVPRPNPHAVIWDWTLIDPTGRDAGHVFIVDTLPRIDFEMKYPGKLASDLSMDEEIVTANQEGWYLPDAVRVATFWRMRTRKKTLALLMDGTTRDITKNATPEIVAQIQKRDDGEPYVREVMVPYAEMYKLSGTELLEGPYQLDIPRLPEFRVPGWEVNIGEIRSRFGLIRFMKDPQRLHNYWRSTIAEKLMMAPRARWSASQEAVAGHEKAWRNAHLSDDPLLLWNGESGQPPVFTPPAQLEVALVQEANMSVQDLRDVSNLHEASLGQSSNEVSGKGIVARQRVGELGTVLYHDNLKMAQEEAGEVLNCLIPVAYDTARTIAVLGEDNKESFQRINDPNDPNSVDIGDGKYTTSITTGPSYVTRRLEAQESMLAVFNAAPQAMAPTLDLYVETQDWPGAEKFAKRLRKTLPPELLDSADLSTEEAAELEQKKQQAQQQGAEQGAVQQAMVVAQHDEQVAKTKLAQAQARAADADADYSVARAVLAKAQAVKALVEAKMTDANIDDEIAMIEAHIDDIDAMEAEKAEESEPTGEAQ